MQSPNTTNDADTQVRTTPPGTEAAEAPKPKKRCGFAAMSPERLREASRRGGVAAHELGRAHKFTQEEAREAGRKGGLASRRHHVTSAAPADASTRPLNEPSETTVNAPQPAPRP